MLLAWDGVLEEFQEKLLVSEGWASPTDVSGWDGDRIMRVARILCVTGDEEQFDGNTDYSQHLNPRNEAAAIGVLLDTLRRDPGLASHLKAIECTFYCTYNCCV